MRHPDLVVPCTCPATSGRSLEIFPHKNGVPFFPAQRRAVVAAGLNRRGLTIVETILTLILVAMLFFFGFKVMSHARRETQKGFWLQQAIAELRDGSRAIAMRIKKTSYPQTIIKGTTPETQVIMAYKELRKFDGTGRLVNLTVKSENAADPMDMFCMQGTVNVSGGPVQIMRFPICSPEKDLGTYEEGKITWVELILEPADHYRQSALGRLRLIERHETYNTSAWPTERAYKLVKNFNPSLPSKFDRVLVNDVENVQIDVFETEELRGVYVGSGENTKTVKTRKRYLISMRIECSHPKDDNIRIGDQCSVVNHVDVQKLSGGSELIVLNVTDPDTPAAIAEISFNGLKMNKRVGEEIIGAFRVTGIFAQGVSVETIPGGRVRFYWKKKDT